jgi:hypothetical protein
MELVQELELLNLIESGTPRPMEASKQSIPISTTDRIHALTHSLTQASKQAGMKTGRIQQASNTNTK